MTLDAAQAMAQAQEDPRAMVKVVEARMKLYRLGVADASSTADRENLSPEDPEAALAGLRALRGTTLH